MCKIDTFSRVTQGASSSCWPRRMWAFDGVYRMICHENNYLGIWRQFINIESSWGGRFLPSTGSDLWNQDVGPDWEDRLPKSFWIILNVNLLLRPSLAWTEHMRVGFWMGERRWTCEMRSLWHPPLGFPRKAAPTKVHPPAEEPLEALEWHADSQAGKGWRWRRALKCLCDRFLLSEKTASRYEDSECLECVSPTILQTQTGENKLESTCWKIGHVWMQTFEAFRTKTHFRKGSQVTKALIFGSRSLGPF